MGPLRCSCSRKPLFNNDAWKETSNLLKLIEKGYLSDPPEIQLYHVKHIDSEGLPVYRCSRGTNSLEGGVHQNVIRRFGAFNASPRLACCLMLEYRLRHNLDVGTLNRSGKAYHSHYDIKLKNEIQRLYLQLNGSLPAHWTHWYNCSLYTTTDETYDIIPVPQQFREDYSMSPMTETLDTTNLMILDLQSRQKTRYAVTPVYTTQERAIYRELVTEFMNTDNALSIKWINFPKKWKTHSRTNGLNIHYKYPQSLKSYHRVYTENRIRSNSTQLTEGVRIRLQSVRTRRDTSTRTLPALQLPEQNNVVVQQHRIPAIASASPIISTAPTVSAISLIPASSSFNSTATNVLHAPFFPRILQSNLPPLITRPHNIVYNPSTIANNGIPSALLPIPRVTSTALSSTRNYTTVYSNSNSSIRGTQVNIPSTKTRRRRCMNCPVVNYDCPGSQDRKLCPHYRQENITGRIPQKRKYSRKHN